MKRYRSEINNANTGKRFSLDFDYIRAESQVRRLKKYYEQYGIDLPLKSMRYGDDVLAYFWVEEGQEPFELYRVNFREKDLETLQLELVGAIDMYMKIQRLIRRGWPEHQLLKMFYISKANNFSVILIERGKDRLDFYRGFKLVDSLSK